jgi:hypothetical protein
MSDNLWVRTRGARHLRFRQDSGQGGVDVKAPAQLRKGRMLVILIDPDSCRAVTN